MSDRESGYNKQTRGIRCNPKTISTRGAAASVTRRKAIKSTCPYCGGDYTITLDEHLRMVPYCAKQDMKENP